MKGKFKLITTIISVIVAVAAVTFGTIKISQISKISGGSNSSTILSTPSNVSYNIDNYTLTWKAVSHADSYKVEINGKRYDVDSNKYVYVLQRYETTFKVQAIDSTGGHKTSFWSDEVSYTLSKTGGLSTPLINAYVTYGMSGVLTKIVSICSHNNIVTISAVFNIAGNAKIFECEYRYDYNVESLRSVIENDNYNRTRLRNENNSKDFDTAGSYLESYQYHGTLEEYRQNGYTISAVSSQAYEKNNSEIGLDGVYKVTNGTETKYLSIKLEFTLAATATESVRYTRGVKNIDASKVYEVYCYELTGDFVDAMSYYVA